MFLIVLLSSTNRADLKDSGKDDLALTWAHTKMMDMSVEEKIGQLFMIQAYSNKGPDHEAYLLEMVRQYHVGSVAFFQGTPVRQAQLTKKLQQASTLPLLVAIDAEWGLGMRLDSAISFPRQFTLGAIRDNRLIYDMGREIGRQLKALGVHINFAPVVDINTNPLNPVINDRSFGDTKTEVARKSFAYMKGMQDEGIIACGKHFPGHGDTHTDSHKTLPKIGKSIGEMEETELFPFRLLFQQGLKSVMVGHLYIPALDNRTNRPASLSGKVINELLRKKMEFEGLVLTDALDMRGVADHFKPGEIEVEAFLAGNDILTVSQKLPNAFNAVKRAVKKGRISQERLNQSVLRILVSKFDAGLFFPPMLETEDIAKKVLNPSALALKEDLFRNAITYISKNVTSLPITEPRNKKIATLSVGISQKSAFQERVESFADPDHFFTDQNTTSAGYSSLLQQLARYDKVLVFFETMSKSRGRKFGISDAAVQFIHDLDDKTDVVITLFGSPYALSRFNQYDNVIMAYENDPMAKDMAAQAIFGANAIRGKLPVSPGQGFKAGQGNQTEKLSILAYALPEKVNLSSDTLAGIDRLVDTLIRSKTAPGCQVLVAKDGYIVYERSFGYHTYEAKEPVKNSDSYDLASITKVMATTLAVMKLYEDGQIDIFQPISDYLEGSIDSSDKADITIIEAMTHHSGFKSWIPFYKMTLDTLQDHSIVPSGSIYRRAKSSEFANQVADGLFIRKDYKDSIYNTILLSDLRDDKDYKYSDLGFYLLKEVIETVTGMPLDTYLNKQFYGPMGLPVLGFNPLHRIPSDRIIPSEKDDYFRMQELKGYVHDMGAAMLGGVSGHAGLFSNASDLAALMQMLLNHGVYANNRYLDRNTIYTFTTRYQRSSRRGIGFDMKELDQKKHPNMSELASASTFGHYGFTGTCVFADPEQQLIYIFLSNRIYPTQKNRQLITENYRPRIQSIIYKALQ